MVSIHLILYLSYLIDVYRLFIGTQLCRGAIEILIDGSDLFTPLENRTERGGPLTEQLK